MLVKMIELILIWQLLQLPLFYSISFIPLEVIGAIKVLIEDQLTTPKKQTVCVS
jgi:hypothetical protein